MQQDIIIGLDISKDKIDCHIERPSNQTHIIISNDPQGYQTLLAHLQPADYPYIKACCEATNTYWQGIVSIRIKIPHRARPFSPTIRIGKSATCSHHNATTTTVRIPTPNLPESA